jgi:hypothetical protein
MVDLNAHEAGNGGQSQGKPTARGVLLYSEGYDRIVGALANLGYTVCLANCYFSGQRACNNVSCLVLF